jgi:hypothetical protein
VAAKIARTVTALGLSRFNLKYSAGTLPHAHLMTSVELYGTAVMPKVRELLGDSAHATAAEPPADRLSRRGSAE